MTTEDIVSIKFEGSDFLSTTLPVVINKYGFLFVGRGRAGDVYEEGGNRVCEYQLVIDTVDLKKFEPRAIRHGKAATLVRVIRDIAANERTIGSSIPGAGLKK